MPRSPEEQKIVDRRRKALDAQPTFRKLVDVKLKERQQKKAAPAPTK